MILAGIVCRYVMCADIMPDPHIWQDPRRTVGGSPVFHAVFHNMVGGWHKPEYNNTQVGAHAYSADGGSSPLLSYVPRLVLCHFLCCAQLYHTRFLTSVREMRLLHSAGRTWTDTGVAFNLTV